MEIIPFKEPAQWQEQITLTGNIFILRFAWNALNQFWTMNIYDQNLTPIVLGIKVVNNYDLTYQYIAAITAFAGGISFGDIVCIDYNEGWDEITRYQMGNSTDLFYFEPGEFVVTP